MTRGDGGVQRGGAPAATLHERSAERTVLCRAHADRCGHGVCLSESASDGQRDTSAGRGPQLLGCQSPCHTGSGMHSQRPALAPSHRSFHVLIAFLRAIGWGCLVGP